jgi:iron complex outermembrane receptor protein
MKRYISMFALVIAFMTTQAQDTIKELGSIQIIGIRNDSREPVTITKTVCDSVKFFNTQRDPFFVIDKITPSVYSQSDNGQGNGYSYMRMRGFDQTRINFNLNGVPLNEMEDQGIFFSNMPGFYNYLSSVNVQRGVGSSRYGNTSIGGTVDMESRDMFKKDLQLSTLGISNLQNRFINGTYSSGTSKKGLAFQVGGSYGENEGFKEHSGNKGGSIFYGAGYRNDRNILKVYGFSGRSENQLAFYGVPKEILDTNYRINLNSINDKDRFNQNFVAGNWVNFRGKLKFNTTVYYNNVDGTYNTGGVDFGVASHQNGIMTNAVYETDRRILNFGANANIYKRTHFGYDNGGYYDYPENTQRYENVGRKNDLTFYLKGTEILSNKLNLFWDAQLRKVEMKVTAPTELVYNWTFFNPKAGIKYLGKSSESWFSAAFTQREPTRTDMFQNYIQQNSLQYANPDNSVLIKPGSSLSPESVIDMELGYKHNLKRGYISANLYFMNVRNEFVSTGRIDDFSGFMWKVPVANTYRYGLESEGSLKVKKFSFFYTFQQQLNDLVTDSVRKSITFSPNTIATVGSSYKRNDFTVGAFCQYVGKMATSLENDQAWSNSYFVINGFATYHLEKKISFTASINNLANRKYLIPAGSVFGSSTFYAGQLLNWTLSLNYSL